MTRFSTASVELSRLMPGPRTAVCGPLADLGDHLVGIPPGEYSTSILGAVADRIPNGIHRAVANDQAEVGAFAELLSGQLYSLVIAGRGRHTTFIVRAGPFWAKMYAGASKRPYCQE